MVERVEILTGGASAVYGSDAVAGVVNFIMKKDFEGVADRRPVQPLSAQQRFQRTGRSEAARRDRRRAATNPSQFALPDDNVTDGNGVQGTLTVGVSTDDGRGNLTAYVSYQDSQAVLERDRDYSAARWARIRCALANGTPNPSFTCGGSGTAFPGTFTDFNGNDNSPRSGRQARNGRRHPGYQSAAVLQLDG
jgi:outer membrane receptor protein involved in Fe transport